jgi:intracellular sulfur oxidation DsrE/DsrF family protein
MKKNVLILIFLFLTCFCEAQVKDYRVVFDISSGDSVSQQAVVREVDIIKNANPDAKLEVVIYGQALSLALKDKSTQAEAIQKLLAMKDVSFRVCAITMKRNKVDNSNLLPGIESVPDGIYELISKQREGWGYIKVAH